jgi:hypothetical protein
MMHNKGDGGHITLWLVLDGDNRCVKDEEWLLG